MNGKTYVIKQGFVTDFGSIPRLGRVTIVRLGRAIAPFIIHDWLREESEVEQPVTTKEADKALYELGLFCGESWYTMNKVYYALRCFGRFASVGENEYALIDQDVIEYINTCNSNFDLGVYLEKIGNGKVLNKES